MSLKDYIDNKPVLTTKRLMLRELQPSDVGDLRSWTPDPSLYKYWGKNPGKADKNPELLFVKAKKKTKSFHWGIVLQSEQKVIGDLWVYLIENDRMAKVAYRLAASYQNKGYTSEALRSVIQFCFEKTELQRLWTDVDIHNTASYKVLENCGFLREGCIRQGKAVSTWCDYYIYGLLKSDLIAQD